MAKGILVTNLQKYLQSINICTHVSLCIQHFLLECKMLLVNNCNPVRFPFDGDLDVYEPWTYSTSFLQYSSYRE